MGTKCFHDIQVVDSQQVTNSPKNSPVSKKSDRNSLSSRHTKNSQSNGNMARKVAKQTMKKVKKAMKLNYFEGE